MNFKTKFTIDFVFTAFCAIFVAILFHSLVLGIASFAADLILLNNRYFKLK